MLKVALSQYNPKDMYSMDKIGLFYKLASNNILRDDVASGIKKRKDRLTVGLC